MKMFDDETEFLYIHTIVAILFLAFFLRFRGQGVKPKVVRNLMILYLEGRSAGTIKNYNAEIKKLVRFCRKKRYNILSLNEAKLGKFLISRAREGMSKSQMSNLSAGVNFLYEITRHTNPFLSPIIAKVKRAILKQGYRVRPKKIAPALSLQQFKNILSACYNPDTSLVPFSRRRFLLMACFCYLGMRVFWDIHDLKFKHVRIQSNGELMIWVKISKTDALGVGWFFSITNCKFGGHTVASLLMWYMSSLTPVTKSDYLFPTSFKERPILSRPVPYSTARLQLVSLREELPLGKTKWHSFRRGSTTAAAAAGISRTSIKHQGKWRSEEVELYIETLNLGHKIGHAIIKNF